MPRVLVLAMLLFVIPDAGYGQSLSILHIRVTLIDGGKATPVPRHLLLVSDNPSTAEPRRVVTSLDGTADVRLRPGNYTVESDQPVAFLGKGYQWTQMLDIAAGRDAVLELTADNADVAPVAAATTTAASPLLAADPSALLMQWQDSVVAVWTPTGHASGFVVDGRGLIVTSQRAIGTATAVEVQLTPSVKVAGSVLAADPARDVAILWIDPKALASVRPVPLGCALPTKPALVDGQRVVTIGTPLREQKGMASGSVTGVQAHAAMSDLRLARGSAGGPVFAADGVVVGITSAANEKDEGRRSDFRVVGIDEACAVMSSAEEKIKTAPRPDGTLLPVEMAQPLPVDALKEAAQRRAGSLNPYQVSSSDFEIAFITPVLAYGAEYQSQRASAREPGGGTRKPDMPQTSAGPLTDFSNWSEYVADFPPVLLVRVTPKQVEGFWTTVARGAAQTQGVSLPPIKHFKSGFSRMRAFCGDVEVTPIHPFKIEQRVSDGDAIYEGLYAFDPDALGPACGTVKLVLYSEKTPEKGDTRVVDPKVVEQIWQDFTPYRAQK